MSEAEWDGLPWDRQQAYWEGMLAEGLVQLEAAPRQEDQGEPQIATRQADGGADLIDIQALIRESREAQISAHGG